MRGELAPAYSKHLRKSAKGVAPCNSNTLRQKNSVTDGCSGHVRHGEHRISELAKKFGVSRATVYRHLKRGMLPAAIRRIGRDGKTYPAGNDRRLIGKVKKNLLLSVQALRRADNFACEEGVSADEATLLGKIYSEALEILARWREVV
jgi:DNA-binding transcriptional ArsR family regulator